MKRLHWMQVVVPLAAATAGLTVASQAAADTCPTGANVVVMAGSSASKPLIAAIAQQLAALNITIVYSSLNSSCGGGVPSVIVDPNTVSNPSQTLFQPNSKLNTWGVPTGGGAFGAIACTVAAGIPVDIGISDIYPTSCPDYAGTTIPTTIKDVNGPIQAMNFVVPSGASPNLITYEAAHFLFSKNLNKTATVGPWTPTAGSAANLFVRGTNSGTQGMLGVAIGVPTGLWVTAADNGAQAPSSAQDMISFLQPATGDSPIGILASTDFDVTQTVTVGDAGVSEDPRTKLKLLAFAAKDQTCAYYPDSSSTAYDKQNVRDGHYAVWGPIHFLTTEYATNANVKIILDAISGAKEDSTYDAMLTAAIKAATVPQCAMSVTRSTEIGPISPYKPADPCNCLFDSLKGTKASTCKDCTKDADCASNGAATHCSLYQHASSGGDAGADAGTTNQGYCEVQ